MEFYGQRISVVQLPRKKLWPNATQRQRRVLYNVSNCFNNPNVQLSKSPLIPGRYLDGDKISKSHTDKYTQFQRA
uniref:Putative ovule protein n=1 Tax=Solanum chacoense TaxID=4108 RepID=A0A0V0GUC1_SOLCH